MKSTSNFIFVVCQAGAEAAVKAELSKLNPGLKFSYSRPGFLTFKSEIELTADFSLKSIFVYAYGLSLQKFKKDQINELLNQIKTKSIHLIERETYLPDKTPAEYSFGNLIEKFKIENSTMLESFILNQIPKNGDLISDIILVEENEIWLGLHIHSIDHRDCPGGRPNISLPKNAPSRAYLKLEEAIILNNLKLEKNQIAIEVGSSPGGASFALLERGLKVIGIDSALMDKVVLKNSNFQHIQKSIVDVNPSELPKLVHWILVDINQKPEIALQALDWLVPKFKNSINGLILTLKFSNWKMVQDIQKIEKKIKKLGFINISLNHLTNNKKEINVVALI